MRYINMKYRGKTETIDQLDPKDFNSYKEFRKELKYVLQEYIRAYYHCEVYVSQRCTNCWQ